MWAGRCRYRDEQQAYYILHRLGNRGDDWSEMHPSQVTRPRGAEHAQLGFCVWKYSLTLGRDQLEVEADGIHLTAGRAGERCLLTLHPTPRAQT